MSDNKKKEYESDEEEESNQNPKNETPLITVIIILALIGFIYIYYKNKTTKPEPKFIHEAPLTKSDFERMDVSMSQLQDVPTSYHSSRNLDNLPRESDSFQSASSDLIIDEDLIPSFHSMNYSDIDSFPVKEGSFTSSYP